MLKIYFLYCLLFLSFFIQAQVLDPSTINSAGGKINIASTLNQVNNNWMLDWTLCEPFAIQTWCSKNKIRLTDAEIDFLSKNKFMSKDIDGKSLLKKFRAVFEEDKAE
jgi:hypothetical protein